MANEKFSVGCSFWDPFLFQVSGISCPWYVIQEVLWLIVSPKGYAIMVPKWKTTLTVILPLNYMHDTHSKLFH